MEYCGILNPMVEKCFLTSKDQPGGVDEICQGILNTARKIVASFCSLHFSEKVSAFPLDRFQHLRTCDLSRPLPSSCSVASEEELKARAV